MTPRNFKPLEIPCRPINDFKIQIEQYPIEVRARVMGIAMSTIRHEANYNNHWLYDLSWAVEGDRLHKRVANAIFKSCGARLSAEALQEIANVAAGNRERVITYDIVDRFEWRPGEFADNNSCYWGSYTAARTHYLPKLGVRAVRSYAKAPNGKQVGNGRFWLMPMTPNDAGQTDFVFAFNFYGAFGSGLNVNELSLHILGDEWETRTDRPTVGLGIDGSYINNGIANLFVRKGVRSPRDNFSIRYIDMISSVAALPE